MQLFGLECNATNAASYMCDAHVVSQARETTQILYTALSQWGVKIEGFIDCSEVTKKPGDLRSPYLPFSKNHPIVQWATASRQHYLWVLDHAKALMTEYTHRSGGKTHLCQLFVAHVEKHLEENGYPGAMPDAITADEWLATFDEGKRGAMRARVASKLPPHGCAFGVIAIEMEGEELADPANWVDSYRQYYKYKQQRFKRRMSWSGAGELGSAKRRRPREAAEM